MDSKHLTGALIDQRVPSDGGTFTWAHLVRTDRDELKLITNTDGAASQFDLGTGEHGPVQVRGESELIGTLTVDGARGLAKLIEVDSEGELPGLLRDAAALAIQEGD